MKEKIISYIKPQLLNLDKKVDSLIPNSKTKKILYITIGSLFGFMFLIILIGTILSPLKVDDKKVTLPTNRPQAFKPNNPEPTKVPGKTEIELGELEDKIIKMTFPESSLNIPTIEKELSL